MLAVSNRVAVLRSAGQYCLVARVDLPPDALLFRIDGKLTGVPTCHSVQMNDTVHIDLPEGLDPEQVMDRFFWRYMNHSCRPSAVVRGTEVFALHTISAGHEITFDYHTTEYELATPFTCQCGEVDCVGHVRGFRYLPADRRERLRPWLAHYLLKTLEQDPNLVRAGRTAGS